MSGVQRAAVLLLSLGESDAAEVLKHMDPKEVQKIGIAMATMTGISRDQVEKVMDDFNGELAGKTSLGVGADDYIRNVLIQALGADKAGGLIDRILLGRNTTGLDTLKWMDPRAVADLVRNEHPQIIAIVMAHLDSDQAAEALKLLPERTRADVLLRIATLDGIPPNALSELNDIMERLDRKGLIQTFGSNKRSATLRSIHRGWTPRQPLAASRYLIKIGEPDGQRWG